MVQHELGPDARVVQTRELQTTWWDRFATDGNSRYEHAALDLSRCRCDDAMAVRRKTWHLSWLYIPMRRIRPISPIE